MKTMTIDNKAAIAGQFILVMFKFDKWWKRWGGGNWDEQKAYLTKAFIKAGLIDKDTAKYLWLAVDTITEDWPKKTGWGNPTWEAEKALLKALLVDMRVHTYTD